MPGGMKSLHTWLTSTAPRSGDDAAQRMSGSSPSGSPSADEGSTTGTDLSAARDTTTDKKAKDNRQAGDDRRPAGRDARRIAGSPGDFEGFLFWRASLRWQRMITAVLRPFNLTHVQWVLLVGAWLMEIDDGQAPSQRELAEHNATDVMMTSQVLGTLEKRGLIVRPRDPRDKRVRRVSATPEGAELAERSLAVVDAADTEFFSQIGEPGSLIGPLRKLAAWDG